LYLLRRAGKDGNYPKPDLKPPAWPFLSTFISRRLSGLSAASVASPAPVQRGEKDLSDSDNEEVIQYSSDETGIHRQGTY